MKLRNSSGFDSTAELYSHIQRLPCVSRAFQAWSRVLKHFFAGLTKLLADSCCCCGCCSLASCACSGAVSRRPSFVPVPVLRCPLLVRPSLRPPICAAGHAEGSGWSQRARPLPLSPLVFPLRGPLRDTSEKAWDERTTRSGRDEMEIHKSEEQARASEAVLTRSADTLAQPDTQAAQHVHRRRRRRPAAHCGCCDPF